ncbi:bridging integrator 3 isoform 6-T6 [Porphyrio hochstetteri]
MSWIPFKIGQPKKQIVPKTVPLQALPPWLRADFHLFFLQVERDFEREYGKLQQLEDQTKKLQKDMKKSTDADLAMSKSAVRISSDLLSNPLCEQEPGFLEMVTAFDTAMKRMDSFNQEKVNQIQKTVIEPLKKAGCTWRETHCRVTPRATLSLGEVTGSMPEPALTPHRAHPHIAWLGMRSLAQSESWSCWQYHSGTCVAELCSQEHF